MSSDQPTISIITVVRNAAAELEKTIGSVLVQDWPGIEFIVIDGASTDGTVELIRTFEEKIGYWISEPDKGIYDAMNKGLAKATGEWVNFMNAGDVFIDHRILSGIFKRDMEDAQVIYGDSIARYPAFNALHRSLPPEELWKGMICCHQSMFIRTSVIKHAGFNTDLYFSADYEMTLRLYTAGRTFRYITGPVAIFDTRGTSNLNMVKSARSNLEILSSYRPLTLKEKRFHRWFIFRSQVTEWIYKTLPSALIYSFLKWFYRNKIIHE